MEKKQFEEKVAEYIAAECGLSGNEPLLVTVSGGADSVALLLVLRALGYSTVAAHCNFHLRGEESNRDEQWVRTLAGRLGVRLEVKHFDVEAYEREHGVSTEMACRELRYEWFYDLRRQCQCQAIAVAHHADDAVETFFMNAMRGSGVQGLASIKPRNGWLVRPLLCMGRKDVEEYLQECGVDFVTDSTNLQSVYKRNKLRNVILPQIYGSFPESRTGLQRTLHDMRSSAALYVEMVDMCRKRMVSHTDFGVRIDTCELQKMQNAGAMLFELLHGYGFNSTQVQEIYAAIGHSGLQFHSASHRLVVERKWLDVSASAEDCGVQEVEISMHADVHNPVQIAVKQMPVPFVRGSVNGSTSVAFGKRLLEAKRLLLRHQHVGDRMRPFGMRGSKLLSDLFADAKYTEMQKRSAWVLEADGEIVWVLGLRSAAAYSISPDDDFYLQLTYNR